MSFEDETSATIEGLGQKPGDERIYNVDIHNQVCPKCGAIGSIMSGSCQSCGVRIRLVDGTGNEKKPAKAMTAAELLSKNESPKPKSTKKITKTTKQPPKMDDDNDDDDADNPMKNARIKDDDIKFEEPEPLDEEEASIRILKQIKAVVETNAKSLRKYYVKLTIVMDPFEFKVAKKPREITI